MAQRFSIFWITPLWVTKYIIGEIFSSGGATLYKKPSDQTVKRVLFYIFRSVFHPNYQLLPIFLNKRKTDIFLLIEEKNCLNKLGQRIRGICIKSKKISKHFFYRKVVKYSGSLLNLLKQYKCIQKFVLTHNGPENLKKSRPKTREIK